MKRISFLIIIGFMFLIGIGSVNAAATATASVSSSKIENGTSVKFNIKLSSVAGWDIKITSTGNTSGCSEHIVGDSGTGKNTTQTLTVTCKATSVGTINFSYSGTITDASLNAVKVSGSKSVSVVTPRAKSSNANLKALSVEGYEISPEFDSNTLEYFVVVDSSVTEVKVIATKADSYAKVINDGVVEVNEGENVVELIVTAETGDQKTYKLHITVKELNPIEARVDGTSYTVVKKAENLEMPLNYETTTVVIDEEEIPAFYSDMTKFTLVGLKDENGVVSLFIYDNGTYSKYNELKFSDIVIYSLDSSDVPDDFLKTTLVINGIETVVYKHKTIDDFYLLYGVNVETGSESFYVYDKVDNTIQKYNEDIYKAFEDRANTYLMTTIVFGGAFVLLLILFIIVIVKRNRNRKRRTNQ